jgi:hypothetical protein
MFVLSMSTSAANNFWVPLSQASRAAHTDINGRACQFKHVERGLAELKIYVIDSEKSKKLLAPSSKYWYAPKPCAIDVVGGEAAIVRPSEFDLLEERIISFLDGVGRGRLGGE